MVVLVPVVPPICHLRHLLLRHCHHQHRRRRPRSIRTSRPYRASTSAVASALPASEQLPGYAPAASNANEERRGASQRQLQSSTSWNIRSSSSSSSTAEYDDMPSAAPTVALPLWLLPLEMVLLLVVAAAPKW